MRGQLPSAHPASQLEVRLYRTFNWPPQRLSHDGLRNRASMRQSHVAESATGAPKPGGDQMLTRKFTLTVLVGGLLAAACGGAPAASAKVSPAVPAGITAYGYPKVMATLQFKPGQAGTLTSGPITIQVPA